MAMTEAVVLTRRAIRQHTVRTACVALAGGWALGILSCNWLHLEPVPRQVPAALIHLGQHLCKQWAGLATLARTGPDRYTFQCHDLAQFPEVHVKLKKED